MVAYLRAGGSYYRLVRPSREVGSLRTEFYYGCEVKMQNNSFVPIRISALVGLVPSLWMSTRRSKLTSKKPENASAPSWRHSFGRPKPWRKPGEASSQLWMSKGTINSWGRLRMPRHNVNNKKHFLQNVKDVGITMPVKPSEMYSCLWSCMYRYRYGWSWTSLAVNSTIQQD